MLLTPEAELVLRSAKVGVDARWETLCAQPIEWAKVVALAADERAASVLARKLPCGVPQDIQSAFHKLSLVAEFRLARLDQLFDATLSTLERMGIEAMLLKGGALVARGIATTTERPMSDIDILVAPEAAREAWEGLQQSGWNWDRDRFPADLYEHQHHLPPLIDAGRSSYRLEVHRDLFPCGHPFALRAPDVLRRSERVSFRGHRVLVPNLHDSLIHTAVHFVWSHGLESKAWRTFRDVELLVSRTNLDWPTLVQVARQTRSASCVYWTLRLTGATIMTPIENQVFEALRPPRSALTLQLLERHYIRNLLIAGRRCPSERVRRRLWEVGVLAEYDRSGIVARSTVRIPEVVEWERSHHRTGILDRVRRTGRLIRYFWSLIWSKKESPVLH